MDFTLSKKHEMARALFKEFAEKEVKPFAQEVDETEEFPRATVEKMGYSIVWDDREFIILYKNGELTLPNSSWVRNAVYKKLIGG